MTLTPIDAHDDDLIRRGDAAKAADFEAHYAMREGMTYGPDGRSRAYHSIAAIAAADPTDWKARAEKAEAELEKANNEFGCRTAHWPDLWMRIAELKEGCRQATLARMEANGLNLAAKLKGNAE